MINTSSNLYHILHCFLDIAFDKCNIAIHCIWLPLLRLTPPPWTERFLWDDLQRGVRIVEYIIGIIIGIIADSRVVKSLDCGARGPGF